jgi:hypothetical protein
MRALAAMLALTGLGSAQVAQAAKPACIAPHDMRTLIRVALPDAIESIAGRCKAALPADAFLPNEGEGLARRYRAQAPVDPARVRAAVEAATGQDLSSFASDDTVYALARQFIDDQIANRVPTRECENIDGMIELASNLRADAMAEAILLALQVAGPHVVKGIAICPPKEDGAADDRFQPSR